MPLRAWERMATRLVALAMGAGRPKKSKVGKTIKEPPPASTFKKPATKPSGIKIKKALKDRLSMTLTHKCLLCGHKASFFAKSKERSFDQCPQCSLIFVPLGEHLTLAEEQRRYAQHQNDCMDPQYQKFLTPFMEALKQRVSPSEIGLDYGCGPAKPLENWLGDEGYSIKSFDPLFFKDPSLLNFAYPYICLTEVLEHFRKPLKELKALDKILKPGGLLALQTRLLPQGPWGKAKNFFQWHYARDLTHVAFYSPKSLNWIAQQLAWKVELLKDPLVFFRK